jgi:sterol desaturase/sphingolipid hydroxylase (fatty acid hydroxylase superfamily)
MPLSFHIGLWTLVSLFFYILDRTEYKKYRLQKGEINYQKYNQALKLTYINIFTILVPLAYIFGIYLIPFRKNYFNLSEVITNIPLLVLIETLLMIIIYDPVFYISHYALHTNFLFKYHKKHHEYDKPIVAAGYYYGILEMIIVVLGFLILPMIIGSHPYSYTILVSLGALSVTMTHSGYKTYIFATEEHEIHHRYPNKNYGTYLFMDKICGTYHYNK